MIYIFAYHKLIIIKEEGNNCRGGFRGVSGNPFWVGL